MNRSFLASFLLWGALLGAAGRASAQTNYWERRSQSEALRERERIQDQTRKPNTPYQPLTVDQGAVQQLVDGWKTSEADAAKYRKQQADQADAARRQREAVADAAARVERARRDAYMGPLRAQYTGTLPEADREERFRTGYFQFVNRMAGAELFQPQSVEAYTAFFRDSATASYQTLLERAAHARFYFPTVGRACFRVLARRFPDQRARTDRNELLALPYFFGGSYVQLYPQLPAYPASHYEAADYQGQKALLDRFQELARAYPALGLQAAGRCRDHLNLYGQLAGRWQQQGQADSAAACHFKVLYSEHPPQNAPQVAATDEAFWRDLADRRLRYTARWLLAQRPKLIKELSADDWQRIAKAQNLPVDLVAWAFRYDDFDPKDGDQPDYWRRFSQLKEARRRDK